LYRKSKTMSSKVHNKTTTISSDSLNSSSGDELDPMIEMQMKQITKRRPLSLSRYFQPSMASTPKPLMASTSKPTINNKTFVDPKPNQLKALQPIGDTMASKVVPIVTNKKPITGSVGVTNSKGMVVKTEKGIPPKGIPPKGLLKRQVTCDEKPHKKLKPEANDNCDQKGINKVVNTSDKENRCLGETFDGQTSSRRSYKTRSHTFLKPNGKSSKERPVLKKSNSVNDMKPKIDAIEYPIVYMNDRFLQSVAHRVDPNLEVEDGVKDLMVEMCDQFMENTIRFAAQLSVNRKARAIGIRDVGLALDKRYNLQFPEFGTGIQKPPKKLKVKKVEDNNDLDEFMTF